MPASDDVPGITPRAESQSSLVLLLGGGFFGVNTFLSSNDPGVSSSVGSVRRSCHGGWLSFVNTAESVGSHLISRDFCKHSMAHSIALMLFRGLGTANQRWKVFLVTVSLLNFIQMTLFLTSWLQMLYPHNPILSTHNRRNKVQACADMQHSRNQVTTWELSREGDSGLCCLQYA
jgi:hypothetical protein